MAEPVLRLAPHGIQSDHRADWNGEPFTFRAQWDECERDFVGQVIGRTKERTLFFALADEPERGNFVSFDATKSTDFS